MGRPAAVGVAAARFSDRAGRTCSAHVDEVDDEDQGLARLDRATGAVLSTGKVFDSSAKTPQKYFETVIGKQQVIKGWDSTIVGSTVGSRLLLLVPPADGYGAAGQPQAGIKGTDTLVFVVDILAAY